MKEDEEAVREGEADASKSREVARRRAAVERDWRSGRRGSGGGAVPALYTMTCRASPSPKLRWSSPSFFAMRCTVRRCCDESEREKASSSRSESAWKSKTRE